MQPAVHFGPRLRVNLLGGACLGAVLMTSAASAAPPVTVKQPSEEIYHGVTVTDDYRWLEDWSQQEVQDWSHAQNTYARSWLDRLSDVAAIRARVRQIMLAKTVSYYEVEFRQGRLFAIKREPPRQQAFLIVFPALDKLSQSQVLVDPNELDPEGSTAIDWYAPSADGALVAVSLSKGGTESGDVHVYDTATGKQVHEVIPRVNSGTAGGGLAWKPDGSGFFYTRHPRAGERAPEDEGFFQQVYFHKLGTPTAEDEYEIGKDFPRVAEIQLDMDDASGTLLATVQNGDGGEFAHYLRSPAGTWKQISAFPDRVIQATFAPAGGLLLISRAGAPRGKILHTSVAAPDVATARVVVPEGADTIVTNFGHGASNIVATAQRLYVTYQLGGPSELRVFDLAGKPQPAPQQLPVSSVGGLVKLEGDDVLFSNTSFVAPPAVYRYVAARKVTEKTPLATDSPVDFSDVEVVREFAASRDGTKVPVSILIPKGTKRDGKNPALVTGYGGYGVSLTPAFSAVRHVLLEQGFVFAVANLRGGGEYGDPWHLQGNLTKKQNVFDDFTAVLEHMVSQRYTSRDRLAIEGGSNGGLLMGAIVTQHPELVRAVVSHVGIYDMLHVENSPNGVFNIPEFGTVHNPEHFRALYAYSPYHRVQDGTKYPAILFLTGANDPRVDAMQSRKMTARMQEASTADEPILLRTSSNTGHGGDTPLSERIEQTVDVFAFLFDRLGVRYKPVKQAQPAAPAR